MRRHVTISRTFVHRFGIHPVLPYMSPRGRSHSKLSKSSFRNLFHVNGILQNDYSDNLEHNSKDKSNHTVPILARTFEIFFVAFQTNAWHYQNLHFKIRFVCKWYFAESLTCDNVEHNLEVNSEHYLSCFLRGIVLFIFYYCEGDVLSSQNLHFELRTTRKWYFEELLL